VGLRLPVGRVRLDLDGDGRGSEEEALWKVYESWNRGVTFEPDVAEAFVIRFDRADVEWLRGYCRLLSAMGEFVLAHDSQQMFERTAHLLFPKVVSPYDFLSSPGGDRSRDSMGGFLDLIAMVHLMDWPLKEPDRMRRAHENLEAMLTHSRVMWELALLETDDELEWIPSPKQTGTIPDARFTTEMVGGWRRFLDEADAILAGRKLIPFWRTEDGRGVNLRRFFHEPRDFSLVLWVQGTAALPYLERGEVTDAETWRQLQQVFQGRFWAFAWWLN
jgi:hypothetical protein